MITLPTFLGTGCNVGAAYVALSGNRGPSDTFVPRRQDSDPELEAKMLAFLQSKTQVQQTFEVAILTGTHWVAVRHEISGIVTARARGVTAGSRWPDGHCAFHDFELAEDFDGRAYTGFLWMRFVGRQWDVSCATMDAARAPQ